MQARTSPSPSKMKSSPSGSRLEKQGTTYNEVQDMLKGIFSTLNLGPVNLGQASSPKKLVDLDYMLAQRLRDESSLEGRRKSVPRYAESKREEESPTSETKT